MKTEVDGDKTSEEEMSSTANHDRETCSRETTQTCTSDKSSVHIGKGKGMSVQSVTKTENEEDAVNAKYFPVKYNTKPVLVQIR